MTSRTPSQGAPRFCEPRISTQNNNFAHAQLNPSAALGGIFCCCRNNFCRFAASLRRLSRLCNFPVSLKHGRLAHVRSQFSLFRRSPTHKNLPPATFCTSERVFAVLFARRKKYQSVLPYREFRGSANLESAHPNNDHALTKLNPLPLRGSLSATFCKYKK